MDTNYFARLNQINVIDHIEKKGQFSYLSWPYAVAQLRLADPAAFWEVRRFDGLPYLKTETGYFVEVAVTVQGITLSQIHPVLDGKNRPIFEPTAFDINTASSAAWSRPSRCTGSASTSTPARTCPRATSRPSEPTKPKAPVSADPRSERVHRRRRSATSSG